ncbi:hypothetical protein [uncultured Roseibium sp.]|uniref:hypothetical protein n=1 Tax=uncultured Roseibium sp. TaxID=1936171 RepID=UPI00263155D2|nr:hypothetical protein [uncultured Roseibium sp.]
MRDACLSKLGDPFTSGQQELQSIEIDGQFRGNAGQGRVRLDIPANCFSVASVRDDETIVVEPDANQVVGDAIYQSGQALVSGGVNQDLVEGILAKLRNENEFADFDEPGEAIPVLEDFIKDQQQQHADTGDEDFANAALAAGMVAGCIALTGGAACAALAPLLSGLFGKEITSAELEQGLGAIDRMSKGESLTPEDYDFFEKFGAPEEVRPIIEALQSGEIVEIVRATGQAAGLEGVQTDVLTEIAQAAKDGTISCEKVNEIAEGRVKTEIAISAKFRSQIEALISSSLKDTEPTAATLRCVRNLFLTG